MEPWCWLPARGSTEHSMTIRRQGPQPSAPHSRLQHDGPPGLIEATLKQ